MKAEARIQLAFDPLMDDDGKIITQLFLLAPNIKKNIVEIFNSFLTFLRIYEGNKTYNLLDPRFKGFHLVSSYVGPEQGEFIVKEYDAKKNILCI